jgi:TonB family protein
MRKAFALLAAMSSLVTNQALAADRSRPPAPVGNQANWFPQSAYPPEAKRSGQNGRVVVNLDLSAAGKPTACHVISSSGYSSLDDRTCELAMQNANFTPALDAKGHPVASTYETRGVVWILGEEGSDEQSDVEGLVSLLAGQPAADVSTKPFAKTRTIEIDVDDQGRALSCRPTGIEDGSPCESFKPGKEVFPRLTSNGKPVAGTVTVTINVSAKPK